MQQPLYCPCIAISEAHKDKGHSTVHPFLFSFRKKYLYLSFIIIILFFQKIKLCVVISVYNLQHSSYSSFFSSSSKHTLHILVVVCRSSTVCIFLLRFFLCVSYISITFSFGLYTNIRIFDNIETKNVVLICHPSL